MLLARTAGCAPATSSTMDDEGFITVVDRIKELIITGGFNVYPSQVEEALRRVPGVARCGCGRACRTDPAASASWRRSS